MGFIYGWGLQSLWLVHYLKLNTNGATIMLTVGLLTEALIFFLSAFEPPHVEYDWGLVYPELDGIEENLNVLDKSCYFFKICIRKFDAMIENAEITPELFEKLGHGLQNLNNTAEKLQDVSDATVATNNYVANFEKASEKVSSFADAYGSSAERLKVEADKLARTYEKSASVVGDSGEQLASTYNKLIENMNKELEMSTSGGKTYNEQLSIMNKNLTALNAVYELQLQGTNQQIEATKAMYTGLDEILDNMKQSAEDTRKYREEISKLSHNLAAMNTIYGNMLSAMNFKAD